MTKGLFWLQLKNGYNFQFASKELQNDKDIVIASVKQNIEFITYASNNMQNDFDVFKNWFIYLRGLANLIIKDYIYNTDNYNYLFSIVRYYCDKFNIKTNFSDNINECCKKL